MGLKYAQKVVLRNAQRGIAHILCFFMERPAQQVFHFLSYFVQQHETASFMVYPPHQVS